MPAYEAINAELYRTLKLIITKLANLEEAVNARRGQDGGGYWLAMPHWDGGLPPYTTSGATTHLVTLPRDLLLRAFVAYTSVATTNDGSNYWTLTLRTIALTSIATTTTQADSPGTNVYKRITSFSTSSLTTASDIATYLQITKTGTPGALTLGNPCLFFV